MQLQSWGRYPRVEAKLVEPVTTPALLNWLRQQAGTGTVIPRGAGRSYGDSALNHRVLSSRWLDGFCSLDRDSVQVRCQAGVTIDELLQVTVPRGLFPAVVPGTAQVTIGGAIAADIHGKNHHRDGSFCDHVEAISLALANGEISTCSRQQDAALFHATCGGMGLTGVIVEATLKLARISSTLISSQSIATRSLSHTIDQLEQMNDHRFVVAWVDCLARGEQLGRGIVHIGNHASGEHLARHRRRGPAVPFSMPAMLLNRHTIGGFNKLYYRLYNKPPREHLVSHDGFFFPLDNIRHWNRLYGRHGFLQYQFLLPGDTAEAGIAAVLARVAASGKGSFLAVLKKFGTGNRNLLSFPGPGLTLALDFKHQPSLFPLLEELDRIVLDHGGRHYLAKDARLGEPVFKAGYPAWAQFKAVKDRVDPGQRFASLQSRRIGLTADGVENGQHNAGGNQP